MHNLIMEEIDLEEGEVAEDSSEDEAQAEPPKDGVAAPPVSIQTPSEDVRDRNDSRRSEDTREEPVRSKKGTKSAAERKSSKRHAEELNEGRSRKSKRRRDADEDSEPKNFEEELQEYQKNARKFRRSSVESRENSNYDADSGRFSPSSQGGKRERREFPKKSRRAEIVRPPREKRVPCKFFLGGRCKYGDDCPFSHDVQQQKKLEACKFYVGGFCQKGDQCVFMHGEFPCKFFHTGQECYSGPNCKFSHGDLSDDQRAALERYLEKENNQNLARHYKEHQMNMEKHGPGYREHSHSGSSMVPGGDDRHENRENRRRTNFFRDTAPVENERFRNEPNHGSHEPPYHPDDNGWERKDNVSGGMDSYEAHSYEEDLPVDGDITRRLPRGQRELFMRLQQKAQLPDAQPAEQQDAEPVSGSSYEEPSLRIDEPLSDHSGSGSAVLPPAAQPSRKSNWADSDEEDESSDQLLASSLRRLQEEPQRVFPSSWSGVELPPLHEFDPSVEIFAGPLELAEHRMNRGRYLLPTPVYYPPQPFANFPPAPYQEQYPPYSADTNQVPPAAQPAYDQPPPGSAPYEAPHQNVESQWNFSAPPTDYYPQGPPAAYPPVPSVGPGGIADPRLLKSENPYNVPPPAFVADPRMARGEPLEPMARKMSNPPPQSPPAMDPIPDIEASLDKNVSPPLYKLDTLILTKTDLRKLYRQMSNYRSVDDMLKDPRLSKFAQEDKSNGLGASVETIAEEPVKAPPANDFDAFTAMIQEALGKAKRKEEEEAKKVSPPPKKPLAKRHVTPPKDGF